MPLRTTFALLGLTVLAAQPAQAGETLLDRLFGGTPGAVPANPFASNYPSAPPSPEAVREARERRAARNARSGPIPPGRIPE